MKWFPVAVAVLWSAQGFGFYFVYHTHTAKLFTLAQGVLFLGIAIGFSIYNLFKKEE